MTTNRFRCLGERRALQWLLAATFLLVSITFVREVRTLQSGRPRHRQEREAIINAHAFVKAEDRASRQETCRQLASQARVSHDQRLLEHSLRLYCDGHKFVDKGWQRWLRNTPIYDYKMYCSPGVDPFDDLRRSKLREGRLGPYLIILLNDHCTMCDLGHANLTGVPPFVMLQLSRNPNNGLISGGYDWFCAQGNLDGGDDGSMISKAARTGNRVLVSGCMLKTQMSQCQPPVSFTDLLAFLDSSSLKALFVMQVRLIISRTVRPTRRQLNVCLPGFILHARPRLDRLAKPSEGAANAIRLWGPSGLSRMLCRRLARSLSALSSCSTRRSLAGH